MKRREFLKVTGSAAAGGALISGLTTNWWGADSDPLPDPQTTKTRFGSLTVVYTEKTPRRIVVERKIEVTETRIGTADYPEFREFATALGQLEDTRVLLERS